MPFVRQESSRWHEEVPGTRWFRADLHIHTLDDHPCSNLRRPDGVTGSAADPDVLRAYARALLKAAITNGVEVLGLTPHAVRAGDTDTTSATWCIVETWNTEADDDGVPFRDKIYAVFPGFEPNLSDGADGLHLLFLFDPEIGRENYLAAYNAVMGAIPPWREGNLQISPNSAEDAFRELEELDRRISENWDWICLAPHAFSSRGLFRLRAQVLEHFPHKHIRGIELKDSWLAEDALADKPWLADAMKKYHHALFHSSDAYDVTEIGSRFTLMKLASPRVESLRQAFLVPFPKRFYDFFRFAC